LPELESRTADRLERLRFDFKGSILLAGDAFADVGHDAGGCSSFWEDYLAAGGNIFGDGEAEFLTGNGGRGGDFVKENETDGRAFGQPRLSRGRG
jgi:hypothetical protein